MTADNEGKQPPPLRLLLTQVLRRLHCGLRDVDLASTLPAIWVDVVMRAVGDEVSDRLFDWAADDEPKSPADADYEELAERFSLTPPDAEKRERWLSQINQPLEEFLGS